MKCLIVQHLVVDTPRTEVKASPAGSAATVVRFCEHLQCWRLKDRSQVYWTHQPNWGITCWSPIFSGRAWSPPVALHCMVSTARVLPTRARQSVWRQLGRRLNRHHMSTRKGNTPCHWHPDGAGDQSDSLSCYLSWRGRGLSLLCLPTEREWFRGVPPPFSRAGGNDAPPQSVFPAARAKKFFGGEESPSSFF
jgi:hypothetical protein